MIKQYVKSDRTSDYPCPFCGAKFGDVSGMKNGCTNDDCPERPRFHDPVGNPEYLEGFWKEVQLTAGKVKTRKRKRLLKEKRIVAKYYSK